MENLKRYLIAIVIFSFFIVGGVNMLSEFNKADPTFTQDSGEKFKTFNKSFSKLNEVTNSSSSMQRSIEKFDQDPGFFGMINALVTSAMSGIRNIFTSFGFMGDAFNAISNVYGIPTWVSGFILAIISITIVVIIWKTIFKVT